MKNGCFAIIAAILVVVHAGPSIAQGGSPEAQGRADRLAYQSWVSGLSGEQRAGAQFWEGQRSTAKPIPCLGTDHPAQSDFVTGCQEAQRRLAVSDVRRKTEREYRTGWNSLPVPTQTAAAPASAGQTSTPAPPPSPAPTITREPSPPPPRQTVSREPPAPPIGDDWKLLGQPKLKLASKAIGLSTSEVTKSTGADCSGGEFCEYVDRDSPQQYCPSVAPCRTLTLVVASDRVVGYTADLAEGAWSKAMQAAKGTFGEPEERTVGSNDATKMRKQYWDWSLPGGTKLSFIYLSGSDGAGELDVHSIFIAPM